MAKDSGAEAGGFISFLPMKPDAAVPPVGQRHAGASRLPPEALGRFAPTPRTSAPSRPTQGRRAEPVRAAVPSPTRVAAEPTVTAPSANRSVHQDAWLDARRRAGESLELQCLDGVLLRGRLTHFDTYALVLETPEGSILVYKHAVSRIRPVVVTP